jgi:hypothetical protein
VRQGVAVCAALLLIAAAACGSGSAPTNAPQGAVTGGTGCPAAEAQDLTFTGEISGHVTCSTTSATCEHAWITPRPPGGLSVPINARLGSKPIQLLIVFDKPEPGAYTAGLLGDPGLSPQGATLDGLGHWNTPENGGSMSLSADATSASGALDIKLTSGAKNTHVKGSWRCVKPAEF